MACNIKTINGKTQVFDDSGNPSKLYAQAKERFGEEKALELYAVTKTDEFEEIFGEDNLADNNKNTNFVKNNDNEQSITEYRERRRWNPSRGNQTLEGAPINKTRQGVTGADPELTYWAEEYARRNNIPYKRQSSYVEVDENRAKRIAEEYDKMTHNPQDPVVKEAFENLIKQTTAQYQMLEEAGYKFYFFDETNDPYNGNPMAAMEELRNKKRMGSFATEAGFGSGATELNIEDNPMLADTGIEWGYGSVKGIKKRVLANDLFRAVHDAFGHGLEGAGFRARGEENAWQAHARLFTGSALGAITSETRGQNSWLNFGKYAEQNKTAKVEDTIFADQKTGLMPEWTWKEGFDTGFSQTNEPSLQTVLNYVTQKNANTKTLTNDQLVDAQNMFLGISDFNVEDFYDKDGFFIIPPKYYSPYELRNIENNPEIKNKIKSAVEALQNSNVELQPQDISNLEKTTDITSFGKLRNLNPYIVKQEIIETLAGTTREEFDQRIEEIEYPAFQKSVNKDQLFEEVQQYVIAAEMQQIDDTITAKPVDDVDTLLALKKEDINFDLLDNIDAIIEKDADVLENNSEVVAEILDQIVVQAAESAIDLQGITLDLQFLGELRAFVLGTNPTFTESYREFFNKSVEQKTAAIKKSEKDRNYVKLNTTLSEEQVYEQQGLIKVEDGIYIQTAKEPLEELYTNLSTYTEKYPKNQTLQQYVQQQITAMEDFQNAENAEAIFLYKMYFDVNDISSDDVLTDENGQPQIYYHSSNTKGITSFSTTVSGDDFSKGGFFVTPKKGWDFAKSGIEYELIIRENPSEIFDINNENHQLQYTTYIFERYGLEDSKITKTDLSSILSGKSNYITVFNQKYKQEVEAISKKYKSQNIYDEMGDFIRVSTPQEQVIEDWLQYPDNTNSTNKVLQNLSHISRRHILYKNYLSIERNGDIIEKMGFRGAFVMEGGLQNIHLYNTDRVEIVNRERDILVKPTSNFKGNPKEFESNFYAEALKEKLKDSHKWKNYYSNFEFTPQGITLLNSDPITLAKIEPYLSDQMRNYSSISRLLPNFHVEQPQDSLQTRRDLAVNYPESITPLEGQYSKIDSNNIIVKNSTAEFVKVNGEVFEFVENEGNLSLFGKVEKNTTPYLQAETQQTESTVNINNYIYLENTPEKFTKTKNLKKDVDGMFEC